MSYEPLPFVIANIVQGLLWIYFWIVIISAVLTWIEPNPYNPIVRLIYNLTEPVFDFVREHLPVIFSGIDLSPIVVIVVIQILSQWAVPRVALLLASV